MTDNEIIKYLECCKGAGTDCWECILFDNCKFTVQEIMQNALDLINRQKAEIERLQKENNLFADIGKMYSEIRAEATKEFAERLKEQIYIKKDKGLYFEKIDNLAKEMAGDV